MWIIAEKYDSSVHAIKTANPSINPLNLQVGSKIVVPFRFNLVSTQIDYTYTFVNYIQEGLLMRYPFMRGGSFGSSTMGKNLYFLSMGTGKKQVFYNATHHANEWITTVLLYKFAEDLASAYSQDILIGGYNAQQLLSQTTLYLAPLVNPDGMDLVTGGIDINSMFYKNALDISNNFSNIPFPSGWKANILGTDLNLNYPADWEKAKTIKYAQGYTMPAPRDFVGTFPLSTYESNAVESFTRARNFSLILAYHTQGKVIYWKYLDYNPKDAERIANEFSKLSGYSTEITPINSAYAGYKDWFIKTYNLPGYTIEAGIGQNPLPLSQFNKIYVDNIGILTYGMAVTSTL